ncbi:hypothetical protein TeGR_g8081 [Tetraparma gracilis]|uniref:MORN repeat-containing protein n=1 Tax=Tetraparma gracilis TaxID=2962635 RepID=A0ABQ6M8H5_9STRA|nr:hypothetical protein TeGR_g8081 [Tetraparma gracilis]
MAPSVTNTLLPLPQVVYGDGDETNWVSKAGAATVTYADQSTFAGTFDAEKQKQGDGTYTWMGPGGEDGEETVEKAKFVGTYKDGIREGSGSMTYPNGDSYEGEWKNGQMEGEGTYMYKTSGDVYSGTFVGGKKHGAGLYEFGKDKSVIKGTWEAGQVTEGEWNLKGCAVYTGKFTNGKPDGEGSFKFQSGIEQKGAFVGVKADPEDEESPVTISWNGEPVFSTA